MKKPIEKDAAHNLISEEKAEKSVYKKIRGALAQLSREAVTQALVLVYTLKAPDTPLWVRTVILGALGYFISMIDGIPDLTPVLGYTDDVSVMAAAIATLSTYITPETRQKAESKADQILGPKA